MIDLRDNMMEHVPDCSA